VLLDIDEVAQRKFELVHPVDESEINRQAAEFRSHVVSGEVLVARGGTYARAGSELLVILGSGSMPIARVSRRASAIDCPVSTPISK